MRLGRLWSEREGRGVPGCWGGGLGGLPVRGRPCGWVLGGGRGPWRDLESQRVWDRDVADCGGEWDPHPRPRPPPRRRPSGVPEKDMRSALAPGLLQQRDTLRRRVQRQEAENRQLAVAVRAGRRQLEALRLQGQARWQAWQVGARPGGGSPAPPPPPPGGSWSLRTPRTPSAHAGVPSGGRVFSSGRSHSGPHDDMSFLPGSKWGSEEGFWGALGGGTTVGSSHRSHIHLTAKPFNGPLPGGAGPPVPKGKGPKSMAPGSPGSSLPETSQLSLTILPRASEKGLREGGPVACPHSLPPHSRLAPGDQAAGTEVLATKALSLVLSHGQVQGQGCVSGILGPPPSPQARRGSAIAPPHHHESPAAPCSPRGPWLQNRAPPVPTVGGRARRQL